MESISKSKSFIYSQEVILDILLEYEAMKHIFGSLPLDKVSEHISELLIERVGYDKN